MSGVTALPLPEDTAEAVEAIIGSLTEMAGRTGEAAAGLDAHRAGLAQAWAGPAGEAATAEIGAVGVITGEIGTAFSDSVAELVRYRDELAHAIPAITALQGQWDTEVRRHRITLNDLTESTTPDGDTDQARTGENNRHDETLAELRRHHDTIVGELETVANGVGAHLAMIAGRVTTRPGYPDEFDETVEDYMIGRLAFLHEQRATQAGEDATGVLIRAMEDGWISEDEAREFIETAGDWLHDPHLSAALIGGVGPELVVELPVLLSESVTFGRIGTDSSTSLLVIVGTSLAAATDRTNPVYRDDPQVWDEFVERLVADGGAAVETRTDRIPPVFYPPHWGLGLLLRHGDYGADFLAAAGDAMYAFDRSHPGYWPGPTEDPGLAYPIDPETGAETEVDPMVDLMRALGRNPEAAQDFFLAADADTTRLDYVLTDRSGWGDGGERLGSAVEAATIGLPPELHRGGAKIVSHMVHYIAGDDTVHAASGVTRALGAWIHDVNYALAEPTEGAPGATQAIRIDDLPLEAVPEWHAIFNKRELEDALERLLVSADAYQVIIDAEAAYARASIEHIAANYPDLANPDHFDRWIEAAGDASQAIGRIAAIHGDAIVGAAEDANAVVGEPGHNRLIVIAKTGLGFMPPTVPHAAVIKFGGDVVLDATDLILDGVTADDRQAALDAAAAEIEAADDTAQTERDHARILVEQIVTETMLRDPGLQADAVAWLNANHAPTDQLVMDPATGRILGAVPGTDADHALTGWIRTQNTPIERVTDELRERFSTGVND